MQAMTSQQSHRLIMVYQNTSASHQVMGNDVITVNLLAGRSQQLAVTIDGGTAIAQDRVVVHGTNSQDSFVLSDANLDAGNTTLNLAGVEDLELYGHGHDDTFHASNVTLSGDVRLDAGAANDTLTVEYPLASSSFLVQGGGDANDHLTTRLTDISEEMVLNQAMIQVSQAVGVQYQGLASLLIEMKGGGDVLAVENTHSGTTTIDTGVDADVVNIQASQGIVTLRTGAANDTIHIGSEGPHENGVLNSIGADLRIEGGGDTDRLTIDDSADPLRNNGTLTSTSLFGFGINGQLDYGSVESLELNLGTGGDSATISSTHAGHTRISTNDGPDTVTVQSVSGETIVSTGNDTDAVHVRGIDASTTVNTGGDADTVTVGSLVPAGEGTLRGIKAELTIHGDGDEDSLSIYDTGETADAIGALSSTQLIGLGMTGRVAYDFFEELSIGLGSGNDLFTITDTHENRTTLATHDGSDLVTVESVKGVTNILTGNSIDTVNIQSIDAETLVNTGADHDIINIGSLSPETGGELTGVRDILTVIGGTESDQLNVDTTNSRDRTAGTLTHRQIIGLGMTQPTNYLNQPFGPPTPAISQTKTSLSAAARGAAFGAGGAGTIYFDAIEGIDIGLSSANDDFTIQRTPTNTETVLRTGGGADHIHIQQTSAKDGCGDWI